MQPEQKYEIGEKVIVRSWTGTTTGIVRDITWMYHPRNYNYCWGYVIDFGEDTNPFTFYSIPEGYLGKLND